MLTINNTLDGYLKDVEILGNTIQDASNLADIRSVGDKVEGQELYEIPVLSCGKNLFDKTKTIEGMATQTATGDIQTSTTSRTTPFIAIKQNTTYAFRGRTNGNSVVYDSDYNYITNLSGQTISIPSNARYIRFNIANSDNIDLVQLEEGTVATPYEPYQEDKLTILSPTPLEKVGDVCDRIIEKDGVWGVEKNVVEDVLNSSDNWEVIGIEIDGYIKAYRTNKYSSVISDKLRQLTNEQWISSNVKGLYCSANMRIILPSSELTSRDSDGINKWIKNNQPIVKYPTTSPQFIPLPHSQQIKLRTFANKTNISFLTEIEGTIKAQVPKSLGATVNTHTEQISNLNKELDRVKKLEESTVSTVTTESDFTTVEATSNGYFEDVKLEGKTLVNLWADSYKFTIQAGHGNHNLKVRCIKSNTQYTLMLLCDKNASGSINLKDVNNDYANLTAIGDVQNLNIPITFITLSEGDFTNVVFRIYSKNDIVVNGVMLLEGDHTQNPPSYFEGLKSVGDGTDEIVVSSVNENLFDKDNVNKLSNMWLGCKVDVGNGIGVIQQDTYESLYWIRIEPSTTYTIQKMPSYRGRCGFSKNKPALGVQTRAVTSDVGTFPMKVTSRSDENYLLISGYCGNNREETLTEEELLSSIQINKGATLKPYTPHQSDKKRLLYYNEETQTWEKPVLREWDSIEKHSNGKYYYHQRSGEVVLNGSEDWNNDKNSSTISPETYRQSIQFDTIDMPSASFNTKTSPNIISDLLPTVIFSDVYSYNHIGISISDTDSIGTHIIINNNFIDVTELKQWLQANNVTVAYQLAEEKVYECTNIDLITYEGETNYVVESGAISPKTTLKVHNNISNVVSLLQKKVSLLESNITKYMITQNRMQLASTYSADSVTFKVDYALCSEETEEYNEDLYNLILHNILVGKDNYDYDKMFNMILDYASWNQISWEQFDILVGLMDMQHNPPVEELPTEDEIEEDIIENEETPVE